MGWGWPFGADPFSVHPRGEQLIPFLGGWELIPPISVSICLSPPGPPKVVSFEWQFHTYLTNLFISMISPAQQSWNKDGPTAYF